jgi:hypothetical protein
VALARGAQRLADRAAHVRFSEQSPITLKLEKAAVISGRVTDAKAKLPVAGALVTLYTARRFMLLESANLGAFTDAKARTRSPFPPPRIRSRRRIRVRSWLG